MAKIYLSPSNQNANSYAVGGTNEMIQCNRIAAAAETHLTRNGYDVKRAPQGQNMNVSIRESNDWGAQLHIPIHTNAGGGGGTVVFVYSKSDSNMKYANPIYDAVQGITPGATDYGVRTYSDLAELNATSAVAVYIECEFHDNAQYAQWIIDHVDDLGQAIARGVCAADGKDYVSVPSPAPAPAADADVFYRVQVGAFNDKSNAEKLQKQLQAQGYNTILQMVEK